MPQPQAVNRILFLSSSGGERGDIAVENLREALHKLAPGVGVSAMDALSEEGRFDYLLRPTFSFLRDLRPGPWKASGYESALASVNLTAAAARVQEALDQAQPDVVVATSPVYGAILGRTFSDGRGRDFTFIALVTEPGDEMAWSVFPADFYLVTNPEAQQLLAAGGVVEDKIRIFGFPVRLSGSHARRIERTPDNAPRILYLANCARRKAPKILERMLQRPDWRITAVASDDEDLAETFHELAKNVPSRLEVLDRANHLPQLLRSHDVVISRPETGVVHEAIAAGCPLIALKASRGAERLLLAWLKQANAGALAEKPRTVIDWLERTFRENGSLLALWQRNIATLNVEGGTETICRFLKDQAIRVAPSSTKLTVLPAPRRGPRLVRDPESARPKSLLLCDLHTHTTWSDGKLSVRELVDFYGERGFDCLCVTDHLCDPQLLLGKLVNLTGLVIPPDEVTDYFEAIEREKKRAWAKYDLILMTGLEFNKDGYTAKTSTHLLGIDLKAPINPWLDLKELIREIQAQGGLAVASHPHEVKGHWGKNTLYLWENLEEFAPLLDAWEVANRDDIFNPVGLKKLPFIANSDFHKPKHIHSWKTLLYCEKEAEAIKQCIRVNRDVSLTLYRDHRFGAAETLDTPTLEKDETAPPVKKRA